MLRNGEKQSFRILEAHKQEQSIRGMFSVFSLRHWVEYNRSALNHSNVQTLLQAMQHELLNVHAEKLEEKRASP